MDKSKEQISLKHLIFPSVPEKSVYKPHPAQADHTLHRVNTVSYTHLELEFDFENALTYELEEYIMSYADLTGDEE